MQLETDELGATDTSNHNESQDITYGAQLGYCFTQMYYNISVSKYINCSPQETKMIKKITMLLYTAFYKHVLILIALCV